MEFEVTVVYKFRVHADSKIDAELAVSEIVAEDPENYWDAEAKEV